MGEGWRLNSFGTVSNNLLKKLRPCNIWKLINSLKLRNACGINGIPNKCSRHLPRRPMVHLTHLFYHCL
jgi:hypothetical protein